MAWNRPSDDGRARTPAAPRRAGTARPTVRGAIAGVIVVLGAAVAAWWLWPSASVPVAEDGDGTVGRRIKEVKPTVARLREGKPDLAKENARPRTAEELRHERAMAAAEKRSKAYAEQKPLKLFSDDSYYGRIFENHVDRSIADLIDTEPGDTIVGSSENLYSSDDFKRRFLESLKTPIIVSHDDPEDVAELKRAVNQAKIEMKARYDEGEDLAKIMIAARDELKDLYEFKKEVESELEKATADKDLDEASVNAMVDAVNKVMEEKGMRKLSMPITTALRFQRMRERSQQISE